MQVRLRPMTSHVLWPPQMCIPALGVGCETSQESRSEAVRGGLWAVATARCEMDEIRLYPVFDVTAVKRLLLSYRCLFSRRRWGVGGMYFAFSTTVVESTKKTAHIASHPLPRRESNTERLYQISCWTETKPIAP